MAIYVILVCFAVVAIVLSFQINEKRVLAKNLRLQGRDEVSLDRIFQEYFKDHGVDEIVFKEVWTEAANIMRLDSLRIRPGDRFDSGLAPVTDCLIEDEIVDLEYYVQKKCAEFGLSERDIPTVNTMEDLVLVLVRENKLIA